MAFASDAPTVNLGIKYSGKVQEEFYRESLLQGRLSAKVEFVGAKGVRLHTVNTLPMNDYDRTASANRYGVPQEIGDTIQSLEMRQDKSFTGIIDKGNQLDQAIKKSGTFVRNQTRQVIIPMKDAHGFSVLANNGGMIANGSAALTKDDVLDHFNAGREYLVNHDVAIDQCTIFCRASMYTLLINTPLFINARELGAKALIKGQIGVMYEAPVVEVPDYRFPAGVNFLFVHKEAGASPAKIEDTKMHTNPPGISGYLIEGRFYWDTFVIGAKADGIYADLTTGNGVSRLAAPTINATTGAITGVVGSAAAFYTTDGTDPRYSASAVQGTAPVVTPGVTVKAYQANNQDSSVYPSPVAEKLITTP